MRKINTEMAINYDTLRIEGEASKRERDILRR
jgi:hypothetical protein